MTTNDKDLAGNKAVDLYPGVANPTTSSLNSDPLQSNFVRESCSFIASHDLVIDTTSHTGDRPYDRRLRCGRRAKLQGTPERPPELPRDGRCRGSRPGAHRVDEHRPAQRELQQRCARVPIPHSFSARKSSAHLKLRLPQMTAGQTPLPHRARVLDQDHQGPESAHSLLAQRALQLRWRLAPRA